MNSTIDDYETDTRTPCQYGLKCYQKNKEHHEKYKHPSKPKVNAPKYSRILFQNIPYPYKRLNHFQDVEKQSMTKKETNSSSLKQQKLNVFFKRISPQKMEGKVKNVEDTEKPCTPKRSVDDSPEESMLKKSKTEIKGVFKEIKTKLDSHKNEAKDVELDREECCKIIKKFFLVDMPDDFYSFWSFCRSLNRGNITGNL